MSSLQGRLTLPTLLAAAGLILLAGLLLDRLVEREIEKSLDASLVAKAESMVALTEQEGSEVLVEFADVYLPHLPRRELVEIRLDDGRVLARSAALGELRLEDDGRRSYVPRLRDVQLPDGRPGRQIQVDFLPLLEGTEGAVLAVAGPPELAASNPARRVVTVLAAVDSGETAAQIGRTRGTLALVSFGLLAVLALVLPWLVRRGMRPLVELGNQVQQLDAARLDTPLHITNPPEELQPLLLRLDDLRTRLARSFERERRFSSDVAHELRTPIAELRNLAEVALRFPPEGQANLSFYRDALTTGLRMGQVVEQLLTLAQFENSHSKPQLELLPLLPLIEAALARHPAVEFPDRETIDQAKVLTCPPLFDLLLENLLSNARDHRVPGTPVKLEVGAVATALNMPRWRLACRNQTAELEKADLEWLFDRFWRKDAARTGSQHSGLGLALSRSIADVLGIDIAVALDHDIFEISLEIPGLR